MLRRALQCMCKTERRSLRVAAIACLILALLLPSGLAGAIITLPHAFHGAVHIGGEPAAAGTVVIAKIGGQVSGTITTLYLGKYGSNAAGDFGPGIQKLVVEGEHIINGDLIEFYVSGAKADQTYIFDSGHVTPLDLTIEGTPVTGVTREVNGDLLPAVSLMLDGTGPELSDLDALYEITAIAVGTYDLMADKDGFRQRTQIVNVAGVGPTYEVTRNFQGVTGLIPNAPDMLYALECVNLWLYPPNPDIGLDMLTALDVINAWLYPVID